MTSEVGADPTAPVTDSGSWAVGRGRRELPERSQRRLNAFALLLRDEACEDLSELWMPRSGVDVLPAVSLEERGLDCACLNLIDTATARRDEVTGVIVGLGAKNAVQWVTGG